MMKVDIVSEKKDLDEPISRSQIVLWSGERNGEVTGWLVR